MCNCKEFPLCNALYGNMPIRHIRSVNMAGLIYEYNHNWGANIYTKVSFPFPLPCMVGPTAKFPETPHIITFLTIRQVKDLHTSSPDTSLAVESKGPLPVVRQPATGQRLWASSINFQFSQHIYLTVILCQNSTSPSRYTKWRFIRKKSLHTNSAGLSTIFHIKMPFPAQLPNLQWVSDMNQVPNFEGIGTRTLFAIWRSLVGECEDYCLHVETVTSTAALEQADFSVNHCQSLFH